VRRLLDAVKRSLDIRLHCIFFVTALNNPFRSDTLDQMRVRIPKAKGQLLVVDWLDACGYINEDLEDAKPAPCKTLGWLKEVKEDYIVLCTSQFSDGSGDFTVLPTGMITGISDPTQKKCQRCQPSSAHSLAVAQPSH